jgi:predicted TIM-barrel enzyme
MDFKKKPILAMIHLSGDESNRLSRAMEEIEILTEEGVDGIVVENYHGNVDDMIRVLSKLGDYNGLLGLNILPNEYELAFKMADEFNAKFIQLDFVSGTYWNNKSINEQHYFEVKNKFSDITVFGGVWPKYYEPIKDSVLKDDLEVAIKRTEAIVVTGKGTGKQTPIDKIKDFRNLIGEHPLIVGAGVTPLNVVEQLSIADGAIVGSCLKLGGLTTQKIQRHLVKEFMDEVKKVRK